MSIKIFDAMDSHSNVIGTTDKKTVHSTGELHRVTDVYLFN